MANVILGLSLGTRHLGVAILKEGNLCDWRVKNFIEAWSEKKAIRITNCIESLVIQHVVDHIACKIPHNARSSYQLHHLLEKIKSISKEYKIDLHIYFISEVRPQGVDNKHDLTAYVVTKYPELYSTHEMEKRTTITYHTRIFEAVAAALKCAAMQH